mmetsp:Transcript_9069/g.27236  ORF Transcript_9069/g.27236 Transcript_9069/m.27236 type:complete len:217 (+) Transcript_9069:590-1240(+)
MKSLFMQPWQSVQHRRPALLLPDGAQRQAPEVQQARDRHAGCQGVGEGCGDGPSAAGRLVHAEEHGEADEEVNGVKQGPHSVHAFFVLMFVVGEVCDGERLHEGGGVRQAEHHRPHGHQPGRRPRGPRYGRPPQAHTAQRMIEAEVRMRHKVERDWHIIEAPGFEGILGAQQHIEVVRPEVVPNEAENGDPHVGPHPVPLYQGASGLLRGLRQHQG